MSYDQPTIDRLAFLYGPERTARIVDYQDAPTNADIEAWEDLGRGSTVAPSERADRSKKIMELHSHGVDKALIAERLGLRIIVVSTTIESRLRADYARRRRR